MSTVAPHWRAGWWRHAEPVASPNCNARPSGCETSLALIHSISLPPGVYGGDAIERLFTNTLDWSAHAYYEQIRGLQVSSHFLIRRDGRCQQFVSVQDRAWHAGASVWRGREQCNDYSVGIELEGLEGERFDAPQYTSLARLLHALSAVLPLRDVAGHEHVAPGRKIDPGPGFDWALLRRLMDGSRLDFPAAV